jgi:hypothetical protein
MYMRLGFSVAIHSEPEVLLVDEVLAVGDIGFRLRSFDRMRALQQSGAALVFVSHWLQAVQMLCPRTVCMHHGRVEFDGPTEHAIARHHELLSQDSARGNTELRPVRVLERELVATRRGALGIVRQDDLMSYRVRLRFDEALHSPQLLFQVIAEDSTLVYQMQTPIGEVWRSFAAGEETEVVVRFRPRLGGGGTFRVAMQVTSTDTSITFVNDDGAPAFFVEPRPGVIGVCDLDARIAVDDEDRSDRRSLRFGDAPTAAEGA